jgi:hypothetical protein
MDKPVIRPLTEADIIDFYGKNLPRPCKGFAVDYQGRLACIVGVTITPTLMLAWSDIKPDVVAPHRVVWQTAKELMKRVEGLGFTTLYAVASYDIKTAPAFLKRLGWKHIESSARGEVFTWQIR